MPIWQLSAVSSLHPLTTSVPVLLHDWMDP